MTCPKVIHHLSAVFYGCGGTPYKRSICADGYEDSKWAEKTIQLSNWADVNEDSKLIEKY